MCPGQTGLPVAGEAALHVQGDAVVLRSGGALEGDHTIEVRQRPACVTNEIDSAPSGNRGGHRRRRADVDVARAGKIVPLHILIRHADRVVVADLLLDAEVALLHFRILEVLIEDEDRWLGKRRPRWQRRVDGRICRNQIAGEGDGLNVNAVVGVRRADHDRRRAAVEEAVTGANDGAACLAGRPGHSQPRADIVVVNRNVVREVACSLQLGIRIQNRWLGHLLTVVAQAGVQGQRLHHTPLVLHEQPRFFQIRMRDWSAGPRSGERLREAGRRLVGEVGQAVEAIGTEKVAREVVEDVVVAVVEAALDGVVLQNVRGRIRNLIALDRRLARRE